MNLLSLLFSVFLVAWISFCSYLYTCKYLALCPNDTKPVEAIVNEAPQPSPEEEESSPEEPDEGSTEPPVDSNQVADSPEVDQDEEDNTPTFSEEELASLKKSRQTYFAYNSDQVQGSSEDEAYFSLLKNYLEANPEAKLLLTGHTDNLGSEAGNEALGQRRAESMKQYLISLGINTDQIETTSKGMTEPIADNTTESGRRKNRRVDIIVQQ